MTPLDPFRDGIWLKREDEHQLGAFKWRGALATLDVRRPGGQTRAEGMIPGPAPGVSDVGAFGPWVVVTASTGNHGAATAWAARRAGARAIVFVPEQASAAKVALIEAQGAELRRAGADLDEAKAAAKELAEREGWFFFEDGAEPAQFDGYEAIGDELLDQLAEPPRSVVVPVGNGALAIGVFRVLAVRAPSTERVAVSAAEAPAMWQSWRTGTPNHSETSATFAVRSRRSRRHPARRRRAEPARPAVRARHGAGAGPRGRGLRRGGHPGRRGGGGGACGRPAGEPAAAGRAHRHRPQHRRRALAPRRRSAGLIRRLGGLRRIAGLCSEF